MEKFSQVPRAEKHQSVQKEYANLEAQYNEYLVIQISYLRKSNAQIVDEFQVLAKEVDRKLDFFPLNPNLSQRLQELKARFQNHHSSEPAIQTNHQNSKKELEFDYTAMMLTNNRLKQDLSDLKGIDFEISQAPPPDQQKETTLLGNMFQTTTTTNRAIGNLFQVENVQGLIQTLERGRDRFVEPGKHNYLTETQRRTYNSLVVYFNQAINRYKSELKNISNLKEDDDQKKEKLEILKGAIVQDTEKLDEASKNVAQEMKYGEIANVQNEMQHTMQVVEESLVKFSNEAKTIKQSTQENRYDRLWLDELDLLITDAREAQTAYLQLDPNDENFLQEVIPIQDKFVSIEQRIMLHLRYYPEAQLPPPQQLLPPPPNLIVRESFQKYEQNDDDNNLAFQAALTSQETVHNLLKSFTRAQNVNIPRVTLSERRNKSISRIQKWSASTTNFEGVIAPPPSQRMNPIIDVDMMNPPSPLPPRPITRKVEEVEKDVTLPSPLQEAEPPQIIVEAEPPQIILPAPAPVIVETETPIVPPSPEPMVVEVAPKQKKLFVEHLTNYHQEQSLTRRRPLIERFREEFTYPHFIESNSGLQGRQQRKWIFLQDNTIVNRRYKKSSK